MSELLQGHKQFSRLVDALVEVPDLADPDVRDQTVIDISDDLGRPLERPRFDDARSDLASIVNACGACSGGLRALARVVAARHPAGEAPPEVARVAARVDELDDPWLLVDRDREALAKLLTEVPGDRVVSAGQNLVGTGEIREISTWMNYPTAIRAIERLSQPDDGVPQLVTFVERLADLVGGRSADGLRQWNDTVAGGIGVPRGALDRMRRAGDERSSAIPGPRTGSADERREPARPDTKPLIWGGGVPKRNGSFTGREALLERLREALRTDERASVLPQALHGMGGVGKTQLVVEFVYRHAQEYDLIWWIPAEQSATVLDSLAALAGRLGLTVTDNKQQTARTLLDALASTDLAWLLVYDNADSPAELDEFIPATGGHVVITTRIKDWASSGQAIEVDVFTREESIELLRRRSRASEDDPPRIDGDEADELAEALGDLPLALEQAALWHLTSPMSVREYLDLLATRMSELLSEAQPAGYGHPITAVVMVAFDKLRQTSEAGAQLFEILAHLGGEPISMSLLRRGTDADIDEPLRGMLGEFIPASRIVRDLTRYGLAKVDTVQRVQVHRLVQAVVKESLGPERERRALSNAQNLLAKANPGDPDELGDYPRHREMGPHLEKADMIHAENLTARQAVLDHARFLWLTGDYENSRRLAERAAEAWAAESWSPRLGPDGDMTLTARGQTANALRTLGRSTEAAEIARDTYDRMRDSPHLGPNHDFTLITGNQVGADLRIAGKYREALDFDVDSVAAHRTVFGADETYTLRALSNLAVDYRMIGDFGEAFRLDREIAGHWENSGGGDPRAFAAYINMARSYYGMGAYQAALDVIERARARLQQDNLNPGHSQLLLADRTHGITLRKVGNLSEAFEVIRDNRIQVQQRFGLDHEFAVAATVSLANMQRQLGRLDAAEELIDDAIGRYTEHFAPEHPLTLVARINRAIVRRARGERDAARADDEHCYGALAQTLSPDHPYTICAGASLATDLALAGERDEALLLSTEMVRVSQAAAGRVRVGDNEARGGAEHPYLLMRMVNLSRDLNAVGDTQRASEVYDEALGGLRIALGPEHPEVAAIEDGQRCEGDIEPLPT